MKKDKERLKAIHDDNLISLLTNLNLIDDVNSSMVKCKFCKGTITIENICAVIPDTGNIGLSCDKPNCLAKLNSFLNQK